ncbi:HET-domain-containing protein, partial [Polyplosphaeria fusca]
WLAFCRSKHWKHCTQETTSVLSGLQVIDCTTRQLVGAPSTCEYVTLSYVWGQIPAGNLVSSTLPDDLPNTVRDSIQAVLCLGYRYLWIDRFCVPQEAGPDRHRLINSMDIIYGNAALTLIAAAGEDPSHGLPGVDEKRTRRPQSSIKINDITYVVVNLNPRTSILQSHWNTRGWTYQETLLSHRKLVFTETGVYFQCGVMNCFE